MINTKDFTLLAGNPEKWDAEVIERIGNGEELIRVQEDQHARGRRSAALNRKMAGWSIVTGSSLDIEPYIEDGEHFQTRTEAIVVGKAWAEDDAENHEFYSLNIYLEEYDDDGTRFDDDDS